MRKVIIFLLVLASFSLSAQNEQMRELMCTMPAMRNVTDVPSGNIQFWVGEGSNEVVAAFFFCANPPVGIAYGYRFNGTATINDMVTAIVAADPNFTFGSSGGSITHVAYNNGTIVCPDMGGSLMYSINGNYDVVSQSLIFTVLSDGDYFQLVEYSDCYDDYWNNVWSNPSLMPTNNIYYPVNPNAPVIHEDASISADDIVYWVGNGENEIVFAVNWCNPDTVMAWGVRFSGESAVVADIINTIELYDDRIDFEGEGYITNITFDNALLEGYVPQLYWMYGVNGEGATGVAQQVVHHGDFIKFGDAACGVLVDTINYIYVWETPVQPVELPAPSTEHFDGIVGSEGCQAVRFDDPSILAWASNCVVTRGYQDIAAGEGSALANFGSDEDGTGPSSESTVSGVVSLGDGGYAVLTFDSPISNGEGYDFAVFENALNHTFLELAFVEVSSDGEHYYRFPSVSNTQSETQLGNAGEVDATNLYNLAGKYIAGWGTPFDLEELRGYSNLDIDHVTHVRIVDVVGSINPLYGTIDKNGHLVNDPYPTNFGSSGFDLSGVAVMNIASAVNDILQEISFVTYPNPCQNVLYVNNVKANECVVLYNAVGQQIWSSITQESQIQLDMQAYPAGVYFLQVGTQMTKVIRR